MELERQNASEVVADRADRADRADGADHGGPSSKDSLI